jgi:glucan endo-1,3-alpha-glucosidase
MYMPQMAIELCTAFCEDKGFIYAGMQYSAECYCGNTFIEHSGTGCDSPCAGNPNQNVEGRTETRYMF